jgi:molybdate transport system ATP-binding protein
VNNTAPFILKAENVTVCRDGRNVLDGISFTLFQNESLAIVGPSGSGKTLLGLVLAQKVFYQGKIEYEGEQNIVWVEQQHHFKNLQNTNDLYYQQRFNSYDTEETLTVAESLGGMTKETGILFRQMQIEYLKDRKLIQLSNGENKKLQLLKALMEEPSLLIIDQPFIGLDVLTRDYLRTQIAAASAKKISVIIITAPDEIPESISKVLLLENGKVKSFEDRASFLKNCPVKKADRKIFQGIKTENLIACVAKSPANGPVIVMNNVSVQYDTCRILESVCWKVMNGERWLLTGPNGAGKSTLLSLITADNPQAYANDIFLFGRKRGSGESIWDIKKKIGFLSPELHIYFNQYATCFETVASGLFDTIGLFRQLSDDDTEIVHQWLRLAGINSPEKRLHQLSEGEQRIILLLRALVKDPPLLILDEPCQGLDPDKRDEFLVFINEACEAGNKTMVFVSHYEKDIPACISHYIKLENGKVTEKGVMS